VLCLLWASGRTACLGRVAARRTNQEDEQEVMGVVVGGVDPVIYILGQMRMYALDIQYIRVLD
jgi:hypothetical protein